MAHFGCFIRDLSFLVCSNANPGKRAEPPRWPNTENIAFLCFRIIFGFQQKSLMHPILPNVSMLDKVLAANHSIVPTPYRTVDGLVIEGTYNFIAWSIFFVRNIVLHMEPFVPSTYHLSSSRTADYLFRQRSGFHNGGRWKQAAYPVCGSHQCQVPSRLAEFKKVAQFACNPVLLENCSFQPWHQTFVSTKNLVMAMAARLFSTLVLLMTF